MSTIINTSFSSLCLTADLPEEVEIESLTPQVTVTITIDEVEVFSSQYYIYGLKAYVRDIRSIVESAMLQKKLAIASFVLTVKDYESFTYTSGVIKVVYSHLKSLKGAEQALLGAFLTTRKSALLSQTCPLYAIQLCPAISAGFKLLRYLLQHAISTVDAQINSYVRQ